MFPRKQELKANRFLIPSVLCCAVSICPHVDAQSVASTTLVAAPAWLSTDWEEIWDLLDDVDKVSPGSSSVHPTSANRSTEAGNLAKAEDQQQRYQQDGIRENTTVSERLDAQAAIDAIRLEMLANPAEFLEPEWDSYSITLDGIEEALEELAGEQD